MNERLTIDILDENNWLIQDTKTGGTANPIDGTTNVLKRLVSVINNLLIKNEELEDDNKRLVHLLKNQGEIIELLYEQVLDERFKENNVITITKEDIKTMSKAICYYEHCRCDIDD